MVKLTVDQENNGEIFWEQLPAFAEQTRWQVRDNISRLIRHDEVIVTDETAKEILAMFETIPGWDDGPEYAQNPVTFEEV